MTSEDLLNVSLEVLRKRMKQTRKETLDEVEKIADVLNYKGKINYLVLKQELAKLREAVK